MNTDINERCRNRWKSILLSLGVDEHLLNGNHQACPSCGGKDRFRWVDIGGSGGYICNQCGSGDGFSLLSLLYNWDFKKAAAEVEKVLGETVVANKKKHNPMPMLKYVANNSSFGPVVVKYLRGRGLQPIKSLQQTQLNYYEDSIKKGSYPAMAALIVDVNNKPVSYHITYLDKGEKADVKNVKKMLPGSGSLSGCAVRFGSGVKIAVTEGIETALAVGEMTKLPVWAALNTGGMIKLQIPDKVKTVAIYADNDKNYAGQKAAYTLANRLVSEGKQVEVFFPEKPGTDYLNYYLENFNARQ